MDKLTEIKEEAMKQLYDHLGFDGVDGTYIYCLTRVKEAFHVGTMTLDDFAEVDGDFVGELADLFVGIAKTLLQLVETQQRYLERISVTFGEFECQRLAREALTQV